MQSQFAEPFLRAPFQLEFQSVQSIGIADTVAQKAGELYRLVKLFQTSKLDSPDCVRIQTQLNSGIERLIKIVPLVAGRLSHADLAVYTAIEFVHQVALAVGLELPRSAAFWAYLSQHELLLKPVTSTINNWSKTMSPFVKVFPLKLKTGKQSEAERVVLEYASLGPKKEPGTLSFRVYRDPATPDCLLFVEHNPVSIIFVHGRLLFNY